MIGSIQTDTPVLVIEEVDGRGITYRVEANVVRHFSNVPKPGARWVLTKGIASGPHGTLSELRKRVGALYGVDRPGFVGFWRFEGPRSRWPYQDQA